MEEINFQIKNKKFSVKSGKNYYDTTTMAMGSNSKLSKFSTSVTKNLDLHNSNEKFATPSKFEEQGISNFSSPSSRQRHKSIECS